jgi:biotin-dependent carboxylase-like uncharacterized protein
MRELEVAEPGLVTTVQDVGRHGFFSSGIPPSGAMDDFSVRAANLLVGNDESAAALEAVYLGPELRFEDDRCVAVCGADMPVHVDGEARPSWETFIVRGGETLRFDFLREGARAYVAVSGGIDVPEVLGSRSTFPRVELGGFRGRALAKGDRVPLGASARGAAAREGLRVDARLRPRLPRVAEVRVLLGLFDHRLTKSSLERFLDTEWRVTTDADRVGYRYRGAELDFVEREPPFGVGDAPWNTPSLNYPVGVIQVPGGVEPIVLMKDAVTGGNYASVGTVISADLDLVAQTKSHDRTRFRAVSLEEALAGRAVRAERLAELRRTLAG